MRDIYSRLTCIKSGQTSDEQNILDIKFLQLSCCCLRLNMPIIVTALLTRSLLFATRLLILKHASVACTRLDDTRLSELRLSRGPPGR
jgi:hypothetical protein